MLCMYSYDMKSLLSILADFANGIFETLIAGALTGIDPSWHFIVGVLFTMSPDLDAIPELLKNGSVAASAKHAHDHRDMLHYPIVFIIIGIILMYFVPFWGWLFLIATTLHFLNDSFGTGWGVSLLWPLTNKRYKLFCRRANLLKSILKEKGLWSQLSDDEKRLRFIVAWSHTELTEYIQKYGIEDWVERYYLRLNWISTIEYSSFVAAILLLFFVL